MINTISNLYLEPCQLQSWSFFYQTVPSPKKNEPIGAVNINAFHIHKTSVLCCPYTQAIFTFIYTSRWKNKAFYFYSIGAEIFLLKFYRTEIRLLGRKRIKWPYQIIVDSYLKWV